MFRKILYPTDFSDVARKALDYIKILKDAGTSEVVILHVVDQRNLSVLAEIAHPEYAEMNLNDIASKELSSIAEEIESWGLGTITKIVQGIPFVEILKEAENSGASMIIIGSHGKSNIAEMLLGSVSEKVVRKSKLPVLVIKR